MLLNGYVPVMGMELSDELDVGQTLAETQRGKALHGEAGEVPGAGDGGQDGRDGQGVGDPEHALSSPSFSRCLTFELIESTMSKLRRQTSDFKILTSTRKRHDCKTPVQIASAGDLERTRENGTISQ